MKIENFLNKIWSEHLITSDGHFLRYILKGELWRCQIYSHKPNMLDRHAHKEAKSNQNVELLVARIISIIGCKDGMIEAQMGEDQNVVDVKMQ